MRLLKILLLGLCLLFMSSGTFARGKPNHGKSPKISITNVYQHQVQFEVFPGNPPPLVGIFSYNNWYEFIPNCNYLVLTKMGKTRKAFKQNPGFIFYPKLC